MRKQTKSLMLILAVFSLALAQLACQAAGSQEKPVATEELEALPPSAVPTFTAAAPSTQLAATDTQQAEQPAATDTPAPRPAAEAGLACFGTSGRGLVCLGPDGWQTYTREESPLGSNFISALTVCTDNRILAAHGSGVDAFDGDEWLGYESGWGSGSPTAVACDPQGGFWVTHFKGVTHFDGSDWITYPAAELATGESATELVEDVVIAPDGVVWVATAKSVAAFDGENWTLFQAGQGFDKLYYLDRLALDSQGLPWVSHSDGILSYDGETWKDHGKKEILTIQDVAIDAQDHAYIGTYSQGVYSFVEGGWKVLDLKAETLASNRVNAIAFDANGRMWMGTEWGLVIMDGEEAFVYRMDNAELPDHDVQALAVVQGGPVLPEPITKPAGSLSGRILDANRQPLVGAPVEICVEKMGSKFTGETPCSEQPFMRSVVTDEDGYFEFLDLPTGYYVITVYTGERWAQLTADVAVISERQLVAAGEKTDIGELFVKAK